MKQKARVNRRKRQRRDKKFLERLAHKKLDPGIYRSRGLSPSYYSVVYGKIHTEVIDGQRMFDLKKIKVKIVANVRYHLMIRQLMKVAEGMTVTIPATLLEKGDEPAGEV